MSNPVEPETSFPRLGYLYDPSASDLPAVPALLHVDQDLGVHLEVPFTTESHEGIGRWFGPRATGCPDQLLFQDHEMDFHLFGVFVSSRGKDPKYEAGLGRLRAEYAVEDRDRSDVDYSEVSDAQSEIHGLHEFMEWRLADFDFAPPDAGGGVLRIAPRTKVAVCDFEGLEVTLTAATWAGRDRPNVHAVGETTLLRTFSKDHRPLQEHLAIHEAVRDLLTLIAWKPLDFTEVMVQRLDAPARSLAGNVAGRAWRRLHNPGMARGGPAAPLIELRFGDFLEPVNFASVGIDGLSIWLRRRKQLARFTDPLLAFRFAPLLTPEVALMQASIAAEALGYAQAIQAGVSKRTAADEQFASRLRRVVDGQPLSVDKIVGDTDRWIKAAAKAYNGLKHANKTLPAAPLPALIALTMTSILRGQLLLELGVDASAVAGLEKQQGWWSLRSAYDSLKDWPPSGT
jgi:ApeA-like protein